MTEAADADGGFSLNAVAPNNEYGWSVQSAMFNASGQEIAVDTTYNNGAVGTVLLTSGQTVSVAYETVTLGLGNAVMTVIGTGNIVNATASAVTVSGGNDTINQNGGSLYITATGLTETIDGSGNNVTESARDSSVVNDLNNLRAEWRRCHRPGRRPRNHQQRLSGGKSFPGCEKTIGAIPSMRYAFA
jgi:hypothetical protein